MPEQDEGDGQAAAHEQAEAEGQAVAVLDLERQILQERRQKRGEFIRLLFCIGEYCFGLRLKISCGCFSIHSIFGWGAL